MRSIAFIIVHCTATAEGQPFTIDDVSRWHRARGWKTVGYHYLVLLDGTIQRGRPEEMVGAHCKNRNQHSIGVCYVGGLSAEGRPKDTRTPAQKAALRSLLTDLKHRYPNALIASHHLFDPLKACPCFDATEEYAPEARGAEEQAKSLRRSR